MNIAKVLQARRRNWMQLERLCQRVAQKKLTAEEATQFTACYRAACADLALADAYQLPPGTVQYLHRLVGRAHNQLYRTQQFNVQSWAETLFVRAPQLIFNDYCVQFAFFLFWSIFIASAVLARSQAMWPNFAEEVLAKQATQKMEDDFANPLGTRPADVNFTMAAFYIRHNTGIGLKCFAGGLLLVPGLFTTIFNAANLGAAFGYMARPDVAAGKNFFEFVMAHGPFELTAIVLSAGAGLRLGVSWLSTGGLRRVDSLKVGARRAMPIIGAAAMLFFMAALIEGFVSPSAAPYWFKMGVALVSSGMLTFYFLFLGFPRE